MGAVMPSKMPGKKVIHRKDNPNDVDLYADGGQVWDKPRPKGLGAPKALTPAKKAKAKAAAKAGERPYPNLVDNIRAAKSK